MSAETERVLALAAELIGASPSVRTESNGLESALWGNLALLVNQRGTTPDRRGAPLVAGRLGLTTTNGERVATGWQEIGQDRTTGEYTLLTVREFLRNHSRRLAASLVLTAAGADAGEAMATILPPATVTAPTVHWSDRRFSVEVQLAIDDPPSEPRTVILGDEP